MLAVQTVKKDLSSEKCIVYVSHLLVAQDEIVENPKRNDKKTVCCFKI